MRGIAVRYVTTALDLLGAALVVAGVALVFVPAALVVAGAAVLFISWQRSAPSPVSE